MEYKKDFFRICVYHYYNELHLEAIISTLLAVIYIHCPVVQEKIEIIAKKMYSAGTVEYLPEAEKQIELFERMGYGSFPICMAKTQYSFSADPSAKGGTIAAKLLQIIPVDVESLILGIMLILISKYKELHNLYSHIEGI